MVGYGAQPDACTALVRERCAVSPDRQPRPGGDSGRSTRRPSRRRRGRRSTGRRSTPSAETLEFLRGLEPEGAREGIGLFHASPRDPIWEYVLSIDQAEAGLDAQTRADLPDRPLARRALLHPAALDRAPSYATGAQASDGDLLDLAEGEWLLNPGSVGQPRDGDPRAAWLELDTEEWTARFHRVAYDVGRGRRGDPRGRPADGARRAPPDRLGTLKRVQMQGKYRLRSVL